MPEKFGDHIPPVQPWEIERIQQQRQAARLVCARNAIGQTKAKRQADLTDLLAHLGLLPSDDLLPVGNPSQL